MLTVRLAVDVGVIVAVMLCVDVMVLETVAVMEAWEGE